MLHQLEQCAVRKAFKVTEVNCTGFRAEENVCEEAKGKDTNPERVSGLANLREKGFFQIRNGHKKVGDETLSPTEEIKRRILAGWKALYF